MNEISPEDRRRIYEEERARLEGTRKTKAAADAPKNKRTGCVIAFIGVLIISVGIFAIVIPNYIGRLARESARADTHVNPPQAGSLTIGRVWDETAGEYTFGYAIVTYKNTTARTFTKAVTIKGTFYDKNGQIIDTCQRSFFCFEVGPIKPGFEDSVKLEINCQRRQLKSVSAKIASAN